MAWIAYCRDCNQELKRSNNGEFTKEFAEEHAARENHEVILGLVSSELEVITPILDIKFRDSTWGEPFEGMPECLFVDEGEDPNWHYIVKLWEESDK
jgi:hypothetical protein